MTDATTRALPTRRCETERERQVNMLFTTALEGGIGYWSECSAYRWGVRNEAGRLDEARDFYAVVTDTEDDEAPEYVIDYDVVRRGASRLYRHLIDLGDEANRYHRQAMRDFAYGNWDDLDADADTADMVVQFGLFGEIRYQ